MQASLAVACVILNAVISGSGGLFHNLQGIRGDSYGPTPI
jgi:hypothetical protein